MTLFLRLRETRRRLLAQRLLDAAAIQAVFAVNLLAILAWMTHAMPGLRLTLGVLLVPAAVALALGWIGRPDLAQAAALLDARAGTRDRFSTALDFSGRPAPTPLESLALAECERFAAGFSVRSHTPIRLSRRAAWVLLPLAALALFSSGLLAPRRRPPTALDQAVAQRAEALKKIADALRQPSPQPPSADLARIAEAMQKSAERLKADSPSDGERLKAALREMSSLEAMLNALRVARDQPVSPAELAALAAALAANESTRAAADALRAGQLDAAASQLEKLLQALKERGDPAGAMQQLAQSMQEQAARLTDAQKNEVARQMQAAAQGAKGLSQQALQRLAELLRQAGRNGAGQSSTAQNNAAGAGRPMTEGELQSLLDALSQMKDGLRPGGNPQGGQPGKGSPGENPSLALVESFAKGGNPSKGKIPGGPPGGERDFGHSDNLYGANPPSAVKPQGPATRLTGTQGDGESLQQFLSAANDGSRSTRAYRDNYERLAPAAQNAVEQENIPLGARSYVRRYFENIRPRE